MQYNSFIESTIHSKLTIRNMLEEKIAKSFIIITNKCDISITNKTITTVLQT